MTRAGGNCVQVQTAFEIVGFGWMRRDYLEGTWGMKRHVENVAIRLWLHFFLTPSGGV